MAEIEVELGVAPLLVFDHRRNNGVRVWRPSGVGVDDMVLLLLPDGYRSGVIDILIKSVRHIGWRIVERQAIWQEGVLVLNLYIMGAALSRFFLENAMNSLSEHVALSKFIKIH